MGDGQEVTGSALSSMLQNQLQILSSETESIKV
jgi:hypothetical protein